ncbi:AAA family ATPase [Luteimonas changyuni]|uniref:AAA family ATPase n=1 Tax=Luteimonas sp. MJ145 TaxID=3129234 RepID=UPI0031B9E2B8
MSTLEARAAALDQCDPRDEAMAAQYGAGQARSRKTADDRAPAPALSDLLQDLMQPWSDDELAAAREPHPHVFSSGRTGLFPLREVTIYASHSREGKTTMIVATAIAQIIGHTLGGLWPDKGYSAVIYSGEDDRAQYAEKVAAQVSILSDSAADLVKRRLIVPDLGTEAFSPFRELVRVIDGQPIESATVEAVIQVIRAMKEAEAPPRLVVFETASTLSEAEETNPGFRALILALRRIARETDVAVVLSHHVSQASLQSLPDLNVSTADIRGGTVLINNARQAAMVVNLGSADSPFPDRDARTVLRMMVAPALESRITALIPLDSSKGAEPFPVFFRWLMTDWGPAAVEIEPPPELQGKRWRKVLEMVRARRAEYRDEAKAGKVEATAQAQNDRALRAIAQLQQQDPDRAITARRVREFAGMSSSIVGLALSRLETTGAITPYPTTAGGRETVGYRLGKGGTRE